MKFNIEGFDQKKLVELGIDARGAIVLRWFIDFIPNMTTVHEDGKTFLWLKYDYLVEELPIIASNKYAIKRIFDTFVEIGLMEFFLWKNKGCYSTFRIIPEVYNSLISDTLQANLLDPSSKSARTPSSKSARTKDSSTKNDPSTKSLTPQVLEEIGGKEKKIEEEFLIFYQNYPKKSDKTDAKKVFSALIKKGVTLDVILSRLRKYQNKLDADRTEIKFIRGPARFLRTLDDFEEDKPVFRKQLEAKKCTCGGEISNSMCKSCGTIYDAMGRAI